MAANPSLPPDRITIPLHVAREALSSPATLNALVDGLGHLSDRSIKDLSPLAFDVVGLGHGFPVADVLKRMLAKRPEWINQEMDDVYNLLNGAMAFERFDLLDVLLEAGVDPTYETSSGFSLLDYATTVESDPQTQESIGNSLLRGGTCSSTQKDKALKIAAGNGNLGMIKSLLAHGAGFTMDPPAGTALARACGSVKGDHQLEIVRLLLQTPGASQIIDDGWGHRTSPPAISRAASEGNVQVISLLLDAGARVNPPEHLTSGCKTPLMKATRWLQLDAMNLLIKSGADATAIDDTGRNALHHLAGHFSWADSDDYHVQKSARLRAIDLLLEAGTDAMQKDFAGNTPMDLARKRLEPDIIEAFRRLPERQLSHQMKRATPQPDEPRKPSARRL